MRTKDRDVIMNKHEEFLDRIKKGELSIIPVDEITCDQAEEQVFARRYMINQMVGTLYPSILEDEIRNIKTQYYSDVKSWH